MVRRLAAGRNSPEGRGNVVVIRSLVVAALVAYLFVLLAITLAYQSPRPFTVEERLMLTPFRSIARDVRQGGDAFQINIVGNVVVFTPLGAAFVALGGRRARLRRAALAGFLLSASIEALQFQTARRFTDVDDVILNTMGTIVGFLAADALRRVLGAWSGREDDRLE